MASSIVGKSDRLPATMPTTGDVRSTITGLYMLPEGWVAGCPKGAVGWVVPGRMGRRVPEGAVGRAAGREASDPREPRGAPTGAMAR